MHLNGTNQLVKVTLRNPLDHDDQLIYNIHVFNNPLAQDWFAALKELLKNGNILEKNFCFLGFPDTARNLTYLCKELNSAIDIINNFFDDYTITEVFSPKSLRNGLDPNQDLLNHLHNHFERLQGTVENLSPYYRRADHTTKYAIRELNTICHELESLILCLRKKATLPEWVRSTQITTFLNCPRYSLTDEHRELFLENGYDRKFGGVYMHWTQIGKTLFEVWRDENAPKLDATTCEAITHLQYYSGEFDIEWGNSVFLNGPFPWHNQEQRVFNRWLIKNGLDPKDKKLSLGYLPIGQVDLTPFGDSDPIKIRETLGKYLDIYSIQADEVSNTFDYCWTDPDYKQMQIEIMKPGYDYHDSRLTILAGGDSHIWGSELADSPHGGTNGYSKNTFVALLAGRDYLCAAYPGISNKEIYDRIKQELSWMKKPLVVVCWTWPSRDNYLNSDQWIIKLQDYLESHNYPYIFTCVDNCVVTNNPDIHWENWYLFPAGTELGDTLTPRGFYQWALENKYKVGPMGHPLEEAHRGAAELFKEKFYELVKKSI
jgi:hypothetical protein